MERVKGIEPRALRRALQFFKRGFENFKQLYGRPWPISMICENGAGEGNRTLVASLEGWSFTTKLHPLIGWFDSITRNRIKNQETQSPDPENSQSRHMPLQICPVDHA